MEELVLECQQEEKDELETFRYELEHLRKAKEFEKDEKIEELKAELQ